MNPGGGLDRSGTGTPGGGPLLCGGAVRSHRLLLPPPPWPEAIP